MLAGRGERPKLDQAAAIRTHRGHYPAGGDSHLSTGGPIQSRPGRRAHPRLAYELPPYMIFWGPGDEPAFP